MPEQPGSSQVAAFFVFDLHQERWSSWDPPSLKVGPCQGNPDQTTSGTKCVGVATRVAHQMMQLIVSI